MFFFSSRRRHTRLQGDWSSDVCSSDLPWLHDTEGRRYLDGVSSWWVNLFGHSHPHIQAALTDQLAQLDHVMLAGFTHAPVVELSERLATLTGLGRSEERRVGKECRSRWSPYH